MHYALFLVWLLSFTKIIFILLHVEMCINNSLIFITENIPVCLKTICLSIHLLMDIWAVSSLGLLKIKLLWTFINRSLYDYMPSLTIGKYLEIKWLDHMSDLSKLLKNISTVFQSVLETPASHIWKFQFSAFLPILGIATKKIFFSHSHMHVVVFH